MPQNLQTLPFKRERESEWIFFWWGEIEFDKLTIAERGKQIQLYTKHNPINGKTCDAIHLLIIYSFNLLFITNTHA
jgi:hypothetical protein